MKLIQNGDVTRKQFLTSWGGATGLTQFLPSELGKHGVDFDGDGHINIWTSVPDALASAAQQLVNKGWQPACAGPMRCVRCAASIARKACRR